MRDRSDRRLDRGAQMALSGPFLGTPLTAERDVHRSLREAHHGPGSTDTWLGGTLRTKRTVCADGGSNGRHLASFFAPTHNRGALSARTGDTLGLPVVGVRLPGHLLQADLALRRLQATDGGLDLPHVMGLQQVVNLGAVVPAVGVPLVHVAALGQLGQRRRQPRRVVRGVGVALHVDQQREGMLPVTGLADVGDGAALPLAVLAARGGLPVVRRREAGGAPFLAFPSTSDACLDDEVLLEATGQHLGGWFVTVCGPHLAHQALHQFADARPMRGIVLSPQRGNVLTRGALAGGGNLVPRALVIRFVQPPLRPLPHLDQHLPPRRLADGAGTQRAVHTQVARLHGERGDLRVGDLFAPARDQVLAGLLRVLRDALANVVPRAQVAMALAHVAGAERRAHLDSETTVVGGCFVASATASFARLESDQHVDRGGGPRVLLRGEDGERLLVDAAEELVGEGARPGLFQTLVLLLGQRINAAEHGPREVRIVLAKHPDPLNHAWLYCTTLALRCQGATFFQWSHKI